MQSTPNSNPRRSSRKKLKEPTPKLISSSGSELEEGEQIKPSTNRDTNTDEKKIPHQPRSPTSTSKYKTLYQPFDLGKRGMDQEI